MSNKIDELSESLDKINSGQTPQTVDRELADLLEVATLLHKSAPLVQPPAHILSATVQRASDGLTAHKKTRRNAWMYSGVLGAAATLLVFVGMHGFPSMQEVSPIVTPAPQSTPISSTPVDLSDATPATEVVSKNMTIKASPEAPVESATSASPSSSDTVSRPSTPPVAPASGKAAPVSPPMSRQAPASVYSMKAAIPPSAVAIRLPGRTPESIIKDSSTGTIRQVFDRGTQRELIITQRIMPLAENDAAAQSKQPSVQREIDKGKAEAPTNFNKVVVIINGQEVTLEGRQTIQDLTELSKTLSLANL